MSKTNTKTKSYAEEGLEEIQQLDGEAEESIGSNEAAISEDEGEMRSVSGAEPVAAWYQLKTPTKIGTTPVKIFQKGLTLKGRFESTISRPAKSKDGRKFTSYTFVVRHDDDGKLYGYSGPGLSGTTKDGRPRGFFALEHGSKVHVTYQGSQEGKDGNTYENFAILGNKRKQA